MQVVKYIILNLFVLLTLSVSAQDDILVEQQWQEEVKMHLKDFIDELNQLSSTNDVRIRASETNIESGAYTRMLNQKISIMTGKLKHIDFRWNVLIQMNQVIIAGNEDLMMLMNEAENLKQALTDTLALQQKRYDAINDFLEAERLIVSYDSVYDKMYKEALGFSLVQQLAPKLEKVKGDEQAIFEKIQTCYNNSKGVDEVVPQLSKRVAILEDKFYGIKALSEKIQAMEYKPFIQRIKDYLLGLACVSIILMFFSTVITKIQATKKAREMLKKQKELLKKTNGTDYPTI